MHIQQLYTQDGTWTVAGDQDGQAVVAPTPYRQAMPYVQVLRALRDKGNTLEASLTELEPSPQVQALREQAANLESNRNRYPIGLRGDGPCYCASSENHDGRCLGKDCYCH